MNLKLCNIIINKYTVLVAGCKLEAEEGGSDCKTLATFEDFFFVFFILLILFSFSKHGGVLGYFGEIKEKKGCERSTRETKSSLLCFVLVSERSRHGSCYCSQEMNIISVGCGL